MTCALIVSSVVLYKYINNCTCTLYCKMERSCNNVKVVCINHGIRRQILALTDNSNYPKSGTLGCITNQLAS